MPEGPELHLAAQLINSICKGRLFAGKVRRNPIHKCADVEWEDPCYKISAVSRGKELKVFLQSHQEEEGKCEGRDSKADVKNGMDQEKTAGKRLQILFNFGMSGKFEFTSAAELPKHAHLSFFTRSEPSMALSFVDYRRFGKWQVGADWTADRGPCVLFEYQLFRSNVLNSLQDSAFNKPLCEVLLNQKYFNGIGNYLRAEIIYRAGVRPFEQARSVLAALPDVPADVKVKIEDEVKATSQVKVKSESPDILELCSLLPQEVVGLGTTLYLPEDDHDDISKFSRWLQCYYKPGMKNIADHNKRTMWYQGDPGPLVPREGKSGGVKKRSGVYNKKLAKDAKKRKLEQSDDTEENGQDEIKKTKKQPTASRAGRQNARATRAAVKKEDNKTPKARKRAATKDLAQDEGKKAASRKTPRSKKTTKLEANFQDEEVPQEPKAKRSRVKKTPAVTSEKSDTGSVVSNSGKRGSRVTRAAPAGEEQTGGKKRRQSRR